MDVLTPFLAGLVAAGIIWGVATFLERKQKQNKEIALVTDNDLYEDE